MRHNNMLEQMKEKVTIKQIGNSAAILLNKGSLKVYDLQIGSELEIEYKYPRIIQYVDELPKTISGKILRRELRKN